MPFLLSSKKRNITVNRHQARRRDFPPIPLVEGSEDNHVTQWPDAAFTESVCCQTYCHTRLCKLLVATRQFVPGTPLNGCLICKTKALIDLP